MTMEKTEDDTRARAAYCIKAVIFDGVQLDRALENGLQKLERRQHAFVSEIVFGVVRWYWRLASYAQQLLHRPFKRKDRDLYCLLLSGLYQILFMRVPEYACVSETVAAVSSMKKRWAVAVLNAVLRKFIDNKERLLAEPLQDCALYAHPQWLVDMLRQEWPDCWEKILHANNQKPQMVLRVNTSMTSVEEYMEELSRIGIESSRNLVSPVGLQISRPLQVDKLPGFFQGKVSVQDTASQLVAPVLDLRENHRVLDACAAPGGKTVHILENQPKLSELIAVDKVASRCDKILENLRRTGKKATVINGDVTDPGGWWDGVQYDRILVDVPCSGLGVVCRHPDIKHHRKPEDIQASVKQQLQIVAALWPLLQKNGKLVYTTCSVLHCENESQVKQLLEILDDCSVVPLPPSLGKSTGIGRQRVQGVDYGDGFYYACLTKQ